MMRTVACVAGIALFCIFLCGCGPDSDHATIQEQEHIRTQDVVDALHLDIHRFHVSSGYEGDLQLTMWAEAYRKKEGRTVHKKHPMNTFGPLSLEDTEMLLLLPTEGRERLYLEIGGSAVIPSLPDEV